MSKKLKLSCGDVIISTLTGDAYTVFDFDDTYVICTNRGGAKTYFFKSYMTTAYFYIFK